MDGRFLFGKYEIGELLGEGNFGKVHKAYHLVTGETLAIKMIKKNEVKKHGMCKQVEKEISVMPLVKHPYIVELKEVMATKTTIYLVMECIQGGDLYTKIFQGGKLGENLARKLFQQLITAVDFCHSRGICHRDLKLENILLDDVNGDTLKLADFGLATLPGQEQSSTDGVLYTPCGAFAYMAPEIINGERYDGKRADIWSCGVILFTLLAGYPPFQDENRMRMLWKIRVGQFEFPEDFPQEARQLINKMLLPKPHERITMIEIMETSWFQQHYRHPYESCPRENVTCAMPRNSLNAFDFIVSMASGLDLSALFDRQKSKLGTLFVTKCATIDVVNKVETMAKCLNYDVYREKELMRIVLRGREIGRRGRLVIVVQVFESSPGFKVVEFSRVAGDWIEYMKLMEEEVRMAMKDVVWRWQGDWFHVRSRISNPT